MIAGRGRALPFLLGTLALVACGSHVVGTQALCCVDLLTGAPVAACAHDASGPKSSCRCMPELCGQGGVCVDDGDCWAPLDMCSSARCVVGRCQLSLHCPSSTSATCSDDRGCSAPQDCVTCKDGSRSCYAAHCVDGNCRVLSPACPCSGDSDCREDNACTTCADGISPLCLQPLCVEGRCLIVAPAPGEDHCPKPPACGDGCKGGCVTCDDGKSSCGRAWCGDDGRCRAARPACPKKTL
jgi:hypothetical protein